MLVWGEGESTISTLNEKVKEIGCIPFQHSVEVVEGGREGFLADEVKINNIADNLEIKFIPPTFERGLEEIGGGLSLNQH